MNRAKLLERGFRRYGSRLTVLHGEEEHTLYAILEQNRRKNRYHFEFKASKIGRYYNNYYFYYGPADYDIRQLSEDDTVFMGTERFVFIQKDAVYFAGEVLYYRGVLKKLEDEDVFETGA
jgi:hypothetical protein